MSPNSPLGETVFLPEDPQNIFRTRLFKYRAFDTNGYLERAIIHHEFFFDSPTAFNDPFESLPDLDIASTAEQCIRFHTENQLKHHPGMAAADALARAIEANRMHQQAMREDPVAEREAHVDLFKSHVRNATVMFCLSETPESVLMWSHYADNHRGVCLVFDGLSPDLHEALKVQYSGDRPKIHMNRPGFRGGQLV